MTTTSGFRPPHFSEDIAWLPEWLQPHQETSGDHHTNGAPTPSNTQACKVQGKIACETDLNLFARKDAGYNNCQLFLSGSDNSPAGMTPSGNVLHLYLHLSSNGVSQYTQSPVYTALPKERDESNGNPSIKPLLETSGCLQDQSVQNSMEVNNSMSHGQIKSNSRRFVKSGSSFLSKDNNISGKKHKKEVNCSHHLNVDITNAVELCIAASEALVVSETVNSVSAPEFLPASAVLEVALNVKKARHKLCPIRLENISNCVTDVVDETDLLQDLDEDSMADAYEDVGLSIRSLATTPDNLFCSSQGPKHGCSLSGTDSRVLETPISENQCGYKVEVQNMKMKSQEVDSDGIFCQKKFNDAFTKDSISNKTVSQSLDGARQVKLSCDPYLAMNISSAEKLLEPLLIQSLEENVRVTRNLFDLPAKNVPVELSTQQCQLSSPQIHKFGNDESEEVLFIEQDKFKSRWLGGWTGKDFNVSEQKDRIADKTINKAVLRETSFISESTDIVPDQNSVVKKFEDVPIIASLSSVAYEGLCSTPKGMELSQDLMSSYNLSMADPLCSVVPCSISLDDTNLNVSNNKENTEKEADKCSNFILENGLEDLQVKDTGSLADFGSEKGCIRKINGEGYVATTRRQLASLKSYSMLMPTQKSDLERSAYQIGSVPNAGIPDFLTFEEDINCFKSSGRKETISYSKPPSKRPSNKKYREDRETLAVGAPMTKSASHEELNDETAHHEAEIKFHHQNERSLPLILNYRARRRLQASKVVLNNEIGDGNQEMASVPKGLETRDGVGLANTFAPISPLHSSHPNPCEDQGPSRKRVRFLEAEANKCQQRSGLKPQSRCKTRSNTKTGERLKNCILQPDSRTQEEITCLTNHYNKDWKKMIFQGIEFLLTGFSIKKERELEMLIRKHGGFIVSDVPPPPTLGRTRRFKCKFQQFPVLITPKKVPTSKFLYGCAVNAFLLNVNWLTDSIMAGSLLPPTKYMILPNQNSMKLKKIGRPVHCAHVTHIFDKLGIMLHGKHSFCTHLENIVRHGGGQVFKTLQWLVRSLKSEKISMGVIVVEDEVSASRHLRHCALEQKLPMMPANWIIESLLLGKVIPIKDMISEFAISMGMSEEI